MQVHASFYANCGIGHSVNSTGVIIQNQWNHVMMTYNGQTLALYINGALEKTLSASGTVCQSNHPVKLGNEVSVYTPFKGNMDWMKWRFMAMG
jgi:hypothetical protein